MKIITKSFELKVLGRSSKLTEESKDGQEYPGWSILGLLLKQ